MGFANNWRRLHYPNDSSLPSHLSWSGLFKDRCSVKLKFSSELSGEGILSGGGWRGCQVLPFAQFQNHLTQIVSLL